MNIHHRKVLDTFDTILEHNKNIVREVAASSTELFGGDNVKIPRAGAHAGQAGWQSSNAWDIPAAVGTPVYALADGTAITFRDYGQNIIKTQGKKLYGQSFTVKSDGALPDVYYTHLQGSPINKGTKIQCGQFLGYIMDMPNSSYDHVHIGISRGDISQFLGPDGKLKCGGGTITGDVGSAPSKDTGSDDSGTGSDTDFGSNKDTSKEIESDFGDIIGSKKTSMNESFGKNVKQSYDTLLIPAKNNSKIYSPVKGVVDNSRYAKNCKNQITIKIENKLGYLQYCNISNPSSLRNNDKINVGTLLGKTTEDVEVVFFDKNYSRIKLSDNAFDKTSFETSTDSDGEKVTKNKKPEQTYYDPAMALLPSMFFDLFKDKVDSKTGEVEKRMGYATDKKQVDPWIVNAISKPFVKIGKALGTNKSPKLKENVERIKKLMK